ncbi:MAG: macA [Clostridia bacterium]|jgi:HlyD family secretion protein|nr:macA [Clostridia bacterium]
MSFLKNKKMYFILSLLIIGTCLFAGYKVYKSKDAAETIAYKEETASKGDIKVEYTVDGTVELPFRYMDFESQGEIEEIFFKEGDTFKKGDAVAKQSDLDAKQTLEKAKLAYEKAKINHQDTIQKQQTTLDELETKRLNYLQQISSHKKTLFDLEGQIHKLESEIEIMELTPDEYAVVDIENSKKDLELLKLNLETARSTLKLTERELSLLKAEGDSAIALSNISIEEAKISYENAKAKLEQTNMYAREEGKILTITKDVGEAVAAISDGAGSTEKSFITYVAVNEPFVVTMAIPEFDLMSVKIGQKAEVVVEGLSEKALIGKVTKISDIPVIDNNQVVTYAATIELSEKPEGLKNGMNAVVSIISKEVSDVVTVPNDVVFFENGKQYVQVKDNEGNVQKVTIVTGFSDGTVAEVKEGLIGNERLVSKAQVSAK